MFFYKSWAWQGASQRACRQPAGISLFGFACLPNTRFAICGYLFNFAGEIRIGLEVYGMALIVPRLVSAEGQILRNVVFNARHNSDYGE